MQQKLCHGDSQAKLGGGHDDNYDPFARDVEVDMEEDEAVIDDE